MRRIRGDGNCFYRAFLFAYLEGLLSKYNGSSADDKEAAIAEKERFMATIVSSKDELVAQGYSEIAIESFHDVSVSTMINRLYTFCVLDCILRYLMLHLYLYYRNNRCSWSC
jgi:ubiquitin thioesterase protein OTUB1